MEKAASSLRLRGAGVVVLGFVSVWACAGRSDRDDGPLRTAGAPNIAGASSGGAAGSGGTAGLAGMSDGGGGSPSGGSAGTGGSSGGTEPVAGMTSAGATGAAGHGAGSGGAAGAGGTTGTGGMDVGGMAGSAGEGASSFPECATDEDCEIAADCCSCHAVPKGASYAVCLLACDDGNACEARGLPAVAACTLGRCTLAASCETWRVECDSLPPTCAAGESPSVTESGCWGPCLASTECSGVTDCAACGDAHCVKFPNIGVTTLRCIAREAACEVGNLCECLAPCGGLGCSEQDGEASCYCGGC